ncbi:mitochondrial carrier domain-containing protein [Mycena leptocephala]|nr:mitochondrial carrier domain-containing protein [Mycena leptocephala]
MLFLNTDRFSATHLASHSIRPPCPYPLWLGGASAHPLCTLALTPPTLSPLDLTKVRLQASGNKHMVKGIKKTYGTWLHQMSSSMCHFWAYNKNKKLLGVGKDAPAWKLALAGSMVGGIVGFVGNPGEIVMVRLQGDFAKPLEKRFNYKNCFDVLFPMVCKEGPSSLARGVGPNVFRAILMNASQLASYDFFKAELLKTRYFEDNIMCHFTASFAASTVATTVCSPADVLKSRIMNASGPGSNSTLSIIRTSLQTEGVMFMFKGWVPAWI